MTDRFFTLALYAAMAVRPAMAIILAQPTPSVQFHCIRGLVHRMTRACVAPWSIFQDLSHVFRRKSVHAVWICCAGRK